MFLESEAYLRDIEDVLCRPLPWNRIFGKSVLITGTNGLIASFLTDCLMRLKGGVRVFALCRNEEKAKERFETYLGCDNFTLLIQDVCDVLCTNTRFDYIIHAASNAHPVAYASHPAETMKANLTGTVNLLDYARVHKTERFLYISSAEVYGQNDSGKDNGVTEDYYGYLDILSPRSAYPMSKRAAESLCVSYMKEYGMNTVTVRPWYIYGATQSNDSSKADSQFIRNAVSGRDIVMKSDGSRLRSYCYVSDAVAGILYALLLGKTGEAYNIAGTQSSTIREFAETLAGICGVNIVYENPDDVEKSGYSLVDNGVLNIEKLSGLGYKAIVELKEGLRRTVDILKR